MEKELRIKFTLISVGVIFIVLFIIATTLNLSNYSKITEKADRVISILAQHDGVFPLMPEGSRGEVSDRGDIWSVLPSIHDGARPSVDMSKRVDEEMPYSTRYLTIKVYDDEREVVSDLEHVFWKDNKLAIEYSQEVLAKNEQHGFIEHYKYEVINKDYGKLIILVDCAQEIMIFQNYLQATLIVCLLALIAVFILVYFLSKKAVKPIVDSHHKQKEFITNIIHELKTPLTIIQANTEVMELEIEKNQWSDSTYHQISRLNKLINYLVAQARIEESREPLNAQRILLSALVEEVMEGFSTLSDSIKKTIVTKITPNIEFKGDEESIASLISILLENAMKYGSGEEVYLTLEKRKGKIYLETSNQVDNLAIGNYDQWFDRFYREDHARNSKEGSFGVGLSMAKSIVHSHGGKIQAICKVENQIKIIVEF